ncbi:MAG: MFS transporter [Acidobacteriota bacterium]|nr:MFS transporter [Acidobacteriota bacterium]MDQ5838046.1 MFS transporter [Acidobacteriota bacterium]
MSSGQETIQGMPLTWRARVVDYLGLERNVVVASAAVFLLGLGEELWKKFLPKYLERLGASPTVIGLYGTTEDFFDAVYQYPGGWLADRAGRRRAFLVFIAVASVGYLVYLLSPSWPWLFVGLAFAMGWHSMASPAIFAVIGDALPKEKRAMGFTLQSMLKRVPMVVSPLIGGALIAGLGVARGVKVGLSATLVLAALTAVIVLAINIPVKVGEAVNIRGVWRSFHHALKRLLVSDILIRTCEGMADIFVILYATNILGVSVARYGLLVAIQITTSILIYIPAGRIADRVGRKPFVIATFVCFALYPVAVVLSSGFASLVVAFVIGGLREIGEPSRKAMIVDFARDDLRARTVGLYYLVRSITITPSAAVGGLLWKLAPQVPFFVAGVIGLAGTIVFAATVEERYAS